MLKHQTVTRSTSASGSALSQPRVYQLYNASVFTGLWDAGSPFAQSETHEIPDSGSQSTQSKGRCTSRRAVLEADVSAPKVLSAVRIRWCAEVGAETINGETPAPVATAITDPRVIAEDWPPAVDSSSRITVSKRIDIGTRRARKPGLAIPGSSKVRTAGAFTRSDSNQTRPRGGSSDTKPAQELLRYVSVHNRAVCASKRAWALDIWA